MQFIFTIAMIFISVAFFSLFERKLLGIIQIRKGPNKILLMGILQPFADAIKLVTKVSSPPNESSKLLYLLSPVVFMSWSLLTWTTMPMKWNLMNFSSSMLFLIFLLSLSVYGLVFIGWFSNSKFASIGSIRAISQSISYEIVLSFCLLLLMMMTMSCNMSMMQSLQSYAWTIFPILPVAIITFITLLAESNRSPFDLPEGESELVSGFCIEYGGMMYTLIFLSENMSIMFLSMLFSLFFLNGFYMIMIKVSMMVFLFVWIRGTMPRIRLDLMMKFCWVCLMPMTISLMVISMMII